MCSKLFLNILCQTVSLHCLAITLSFFTGFPQLLRFHRLFIVFCYKTEMFPVVTDFCLCSISYLYVGVFVPFLGFMDSFIQGGPAKVRPSFIFSGNVWYLNVIDKIQWFFGKCDNCLTTHTLGRINI